MLAAMPSHDPPDARRHEEALDPIYIKYADSDPFLPISHFIDHTTMGAEALVALGLGDRADAWASRHRVRPHRAPVTGIDIATNWPQARGRPECHGDWILHFEAELTDHSPRELLNLWVPRFAHDVGAYLFHGLIRTAHAARALTQRDTAARRGELARGLALWAIGVGDAPPDAHTHNSSVAPNRVEFLRHARFGAATFLDAPSVPALHLVTGPMAYLLLEPTLDETSHRLALASFERTHRAAAARFPALRDRTRAGEATPPSQQFLNTLAEQRDAHPAKLTEAALRAHAETEDPMFLRAAGQALRLHGLRAMLGVVRAALTRDVA